MFGTPNGLFGVENLINCNVRAGVDGVPRMVFL